MNWKWQIQYWLIDEVSDVQVRYFKRTYHAALLLQELHRSEGRRQVGKTKWKRPWRRLFRTASSSRLCELIKLLWPLQSPLWQATTSRHIQRLSQRSFPFHPPIISRLVAYKGKLAASPLKTIGFFSMRNIQSNVSWNFFLHPFAIFFFLSFYFER